MRCVSQSWIRHCVVFFCLPCGKRLWFCSSYRRKAGASFGTARGWSSASRDAQAWLPSLGCIRMCALGIFYCAWLLLFATDMSFSPRRVSYLFWNVRYSKKYVRAMIDRLIMLANGLLLVITFFKRSSSRRMFFYALRPCGQAVVTGFIYFLPLLPRGRCLGFYRVQTNFRRGSASPLLIVDSHHIFFLAHSDGK